MRPEASPTRAAHARPTRRVGWLFAAVALFAAGSAAVPPYAFRPLPLLTAVPLLCSTIQLLTTSLRRDRRSWVDAVAPWLFFLVVALVRQGLGGAESGMAPLVALPLLWSALYGVRRDVYVGAGLTALTFTAPILLVGAPYYPSGQWRLVALWTALAALLVPLVQTRTRRVVVERADESRRHREDLAALSSIMRGAAFVGLVTTDPEGAITSFGKGAELMLGYHEAEMVGHDLFSLLHERRQLAQAVRELRLSPGQPVLPALARRHAPSRVWTMRRSDGEPVTVRFAISPMRGDPGDSGGSGEVAGYLAMGVDVTETTRTRRELTEAEQRWRVLLDHLPDTTVVLVAEGRGITVVTGAGVQGHRLRDSAGRWLAEIAGSAGLSLEAMLQEAFAGREVRAGSDALVDGVEHELLVSPLPLPGERRQALLLVRNVGRDRARQREILAARDRAERLLRDAPQGIAVLDRDGVVVQANPALERLFGRTDLVGLLLSSLSYDIGDGTVGRHVAEVLSGDGARAESQWTARGAGGEEIHVALTGTLTSAVAGAPTSAVAGTPTGTVLSVGPSDSGTAREGLVLAHLVDVSDRYRYERQLAHLADHDPLTGLANRRRFDIELQRHLDGCRRYGARGGLLMLDLDHFKEVNDTLGHAAGDELLTTVAQLLRSRLRDTDMVARLGGDEFAVLLPHADRKAADVVAESLVERIRVETGTYDDARRYVTVSVGGVLVDAQADAGNELLRMADAALYEAKNGGRDQVRFAT
ncbi:MAG: bifunctional diguanylate cyclase/phosphodiesterase [Nocardioidaceae bacterium]